MVQAEARDMNLPTDHPMHLGHDAGAFLPKADVVIVIDSVVPWMPRNHQPRKDAKVIHISADPLETRYPFRELEADLLIAGSSLAAMVMLRETLADAMKGKTAAIESRRKTLARHARGDRRQAPKLIETVKDQTPIHPAWLAACINQVKSEDAIVDQRARRAAAVPRPDQAVDLHGRAAVGRARLRHGRRARRQARGAAARGDRHGRRRLLHVRQSRSPITSSAAPRTCRR